MVKLRKTSRYTRLQNFAITIFSIRNTSLLEDVRIVANYNFQYNDAFSPSTDDGGHDVIDNYFEFPCNSI